MGGRGGQRRSGEGEGEDIISESQNMAAKKYTQRSWSWRRHQTRFFSSKLRKTHFRIIRPEFCSSNDARKAFFTFQLQTNPRSVFSSCQRDSMSLLRWWTGEEGG